MSDRIITAGQSVIDLGSKRLGGYLIPFTLRKHQFTDGTDFGRERKSVTLYFHGLDPAIKRTPVGRARLDVKSDAGVWIDAQLEKRSEYEEMLLELAKRGELEWSSAADPKQVQVHRSGRGHVDVARWPLGLEVSASPAGRVPKELTRINQLQRPTKSTFERERFGDGRHGRGAGDPFDALREVQADLRKLKRML